MAAPQLISALKDGVATLTFNRPERRNALTALIRRDLVAALADVDSRCDVAALVLGPVDMARGPLWVDGTPAGIRRAAPLLGQHTTEVLAECGLSTEEIDDLISRGIVRSPAETAAV